ncbi:MAG TPA: uracil-DNA glycosylase [Gammaproteobacteria bacterium]|nr:uracil-DNA glycosylase [Gammaproteobacteria bacterium]
MSYSAQQLYYLQRMGIDVYISRDHSDALQNVAIAGQPENKASLRDGFDENAWQELQDEVSHCTRCDLHRSRTQTVFGVGNAHADWLIIGEAPGADEDKQGEPFVGRAGKLLNNMLLAMGMQREQVFIANILKCRPPNNRDPRPAEVACCETYLRAQIAMIQPKIIVALGRVAAQNLLQVDTPIGRMRGKQYTYPHADIPVVVTYHPAYLLRSPRQKQKSWQDLQLAMKIFRERQ